MKVFYHIDDDGKCAGYWVKALNELEDEYEDEYIKINYGIDFPFDKIRKDEIVYIVDYSILPEEMDKLLKITNNVIWIDHHASAIERYKNYDKQIAGLRYDGIAGCMLTYCYLMYMANCEETFSTTMTRTAPFFTQLIADYDVWTFEYGDVTKKFQKGLSLYEHEPQSQIWDSLNSIDVISKIVSKGETIINYRKNMMAEYCKNKGFEAEFEGYNCFAINMAMINSDDFVIDNVDDYDILIGFSFDGERWAYSLRSENVDCSELAVKYGGGGHKGAAGFSSTDFVLNKIKGED
ncbi:MAG TPA: DHHA1 domain-containing protein [Oscillospiraceae bacterium]|nr:DHHA1 domain-containing protein [Oscillospiraceae bacterium]